MKTLKIALALIAMSPFALGGEPYRESSNIAQFKSDELLDWELDPSFQAQGIGCGLGKIKKNAEGKIVLQAVKRATLNLEIGSFPDKLLKDLSSSKNYKKTQDATKDYDGSSKKDSSPVISIKMIKRFSFTSSHSKTRTILPMF